MGNALKFTVKGHIKIEVAKRINTEEFDLALNPLQLEFRVSDTGVGIKKQDFFKLFKLFGKLGTTEEINKSGIGLGLTICKSLTEKMGGEIHVSSIFGKGTSFCFTIPVSQSREIIHQPQS